MKSSAYACGDRTTIVRMTVLAMVAVSLGGILHRSQGMEWNPFLQISWATTGIVLHLLVGKRTRSTWKGRPAWMVSNSRSGLPSDQGIRIREGGSHKTCQSGTTGHR